MIHRTRAANDEVIVPAQGDAHDQPYRFGKPLTYLSEHERPSRAGKQSIDGHRVTIHSNAAGAAEPQRPQGCYTPRCRAGSRQ